MVDKFLSVNRDINIDVEHEINRLNEFLTDKYMDYINSPFKLSGNSIIFNVCSKIHTDVEIDMLNGLNSIFSRYTGKSLSESDTSLTNIYLN